MKRGSFVPVILLAIAMVALTGRPARSAPTTLTKTTDMTSPFIGSVFDLVTNEIVDVSATLHVVVNVSLDLSNPSADTCSGVTNVEATYSATGRTTKAKYRIAVNTAYPDAPCPVRAAACARRLLKPLFQQPRLRSSRDLCQRLPIKHAFDPLEPGLAHPFKMRVEPAGETDQVGIQEHRGGL